jgi:hypothetical protein
LIWFIFQGPDVSIADENLLFFKALDWLCTYLACWTRTDAQIDTFTFHQLLHYKRNLLKDEVALLESAKRIVLEFIQFLLKIFQQSVAIPVGKEFQVK